MKSFDSSRIIRDNLRKRVRKIRYTHKAWGRDQRKKYLYLSKLDESFQMLTKEPYLDRACDEIRQGYRKHHVGRHLVFY
jgi:toxin ParE1/3/4